MDSSNGRLYKMTPEQAGTFGYVEVKRELTEEERSGMKIKLCSPCACGSGKKFKRCCKRW